MDEKELASCRKKQLEDFETWLHSQTPEEFLSEYLKCETGEGPTIEEFLQTLPEQKMENTETSQKRFHVCKATRMYGGCGYQGPTISMMRQRNPDIDYCILEFDTLEEAKLAADLALQCNPVGWRVYDSQDPEAVNENFVYSN